MAGVSKKKPGRPPNSQNKIKTPKEGVINYMAPAQDAYDGSKIKSLTIDEPSQFSTPKPDTKEILNRISVLESEIKNPPKNLIMGTRIYIGVREKELRELKEKLNLK
jgi:hypothetical protein